MRLAGVYPFGRPSRDAGLINQVQGISRAYIVLLEGATGAFTPPTQFKPPVAPITGTEADLALVTSLTGINPW
ncbi:MAG: hypothetical protein IPH16_18990 [Haliscomenobacter sp.]|nr:hypothetical protein [Haliscomenobacter sp.]